MDMSFPRTIIFLALLLFTMNWGVRGQQAFRTEPKNVTVNAGARVVLKCQVLRASGVVQWAKDGLLLGPKSSIPGFPRYSMIGNAQAGQYHLQIEKAELKDDAPYECQVGQSESSRAIISHKVWINVQIPPSKPFFEVEMEKPWVAGRKYTVTCVAPHAKPEAEIILYKDGVELTDIESYIMDGSEDKLLNTHAEVTVMALNSDNGRKLVCRARNLALPRGLEASLTMRVLFPPQVPFIQGLERTEVRAGRTLKLVCISEGGNPLATLQWSKDGDVLSTSWEEDTEARRSSSLLYLQVTPEDNQAVLRCDSVNLVSPTTLSFSRQLTVHFEPKVVKVLGSFSAIEGTVVNLCCFTSSSNPPVHIRWWLGFRELNTTDVIEEGENGGMTTMSNVTHRVVREENGLPLTCEAFNKGTRFSKSESNTLNVFYPPLKVWLDAPPQNVPLRSGTTVHLICFSSGGNPTGLLTWQDKNGRPVPNTQRQVTSDKGVSRELILVLQPSDNLKTYRCNASNEAQKAILAETRLMVQFPAVSVKIIAKQKELRRGQTLSLECLSGSSNPRANISWSIGPLRLKGVKQPDKAAAYHGVSVHSKLSLPLGSKHHGQRVNCHAFSSLMSEGVNTFHLLNVLYPPEFHPDQPRQVEAEEDEMATLPLRISANPEEVSCTWLHRREKLVRERDARYHWQDDHTLEIWNVTRRDAGAYVVECSNEEGSDTASISLDVLYAPSLKAEKDPVYVDLGETADLLCVADANPILSGMFSWKWLGERELDMEEEETFEQKEMDETGLLTIHNVTRDRAGRYQCAADNRIMPPASIEVQLVVRFKPELQKGAQWSKVASRGDRTTTAEVVCQAEGIPQVDFSWKKNGVPIDFANPRYEERTVRDGPYHTSTVRVVNVSSALDYAVFTCTAQNSLGIDTLDIQLLSTSHPDPPSHFRQVTVSHVSVTLEWIPGFDGGLQQRFRVRYWWANAASFLYVDVFPPQANIFTVTGLSPSTTYNFSVNAINAMGESGYADDNAVLTITTEDLPEVELSPDNGSDLQGRGLPAYVIVTSVLVGGVLMVLNSLCCFLGLRWRRRRGQTAGKEDSMLSEKKSEGEGSSLSTASSSNRYESREKVNATAQRTLLIDSGSELDSNIYESYVADGSHYYYPASDYRPTLYPLPEAANSHDMFRYPGEHLGHEYETGDWGLYQEVLESPPFQFDPTVLDQRGDRRPPTYSQGGERGTKSREQPIRMNDPTVDRLPQRGNYELPFELQGELV